MGTKNEIPKFDSKFLVQTSCKLEKTGVLPAIRSTNNGHGIQVGLHGGAPAKPRAAHLLLPRAPWALGQTGKRIRDAGVATCNTAIICTAAHVCLCHTVVHSRCVLPAAPLQALPSCQRAAWQLCQAEPCVSWPTSTGPSCPTQMKASHNRAFTVAYLGAHLVLR